MVFAPSHHTILVQILARPDVYNIQVFKIKLICTSWLMTLELINGSIQDSKTATMMQLTYLLFTIDLIFSCIFFSILIFPPQGSVKCQAIVMRHLNTLNAFVQMQRYPPAAKWFVLPSSYAVGYQIYIFRESVVKFVTMLSNIGGTVSSLNSS